MGHVYMFTQLVNLAQYSISDLSKQKFLKKLNWGAGTVRDLGDKVNGSNEKPRKKSAQMSISRS